MYNRGVNNLTNKEVEKMDKVDHIGIAVKSIEASLPYYTDVLGLSLIHIEEVVSEKVRVAFIDSGNIKLELLQPMDETSTIHSFIEKKGEGIFRGTIDLGLKDRVPLGMITCCHKAILGEDPGYERVNYYEVKRVMEDNVDEYSQFLD